ncbi:MAG: transposase [Chloroflexi bacterium]|nr:transposase [Chloroflexota bacterium]
MYSNPLPALPIETVEATKALFGKKNVYVMIGDMADSLFADIDLACLYPEEGIPKEFPYLSSLVLIFQFNEGLADRQAAEATRVRTDWKYALHLPIAHPGLSTDVMRDFRQRLCRNVSHREKFQQVLTRLQETYAPWQSRLPLADASYVVQSVCARTSLESVASAMQNAVQALVAKRYEWVRQIARPHWYQRYFRNMLVFQVPDDLTSQVELAESIGEDGVYLLQTIAFANASDLDNLAEIQNLRQVWNWQFEWQPDRFKWRAAQCAKCMGKPLNFTNGRTFVER